MSNDEKFQYDVENLKRDFAMENMIVTDDDVALLKKYSQNEISMDDMIKYIKITTM